MILSVIVEDVLDGIIADSEAWHHARRDALAAAQRISPEESSPGSGLQVYGILARESAVAASRIMMDASTMPGDVVPYRSIAAIVGESDYSKTQRCILESLADQGHTVLPLRLGQPCTNVRSVLDMLATNYEVLHHGLTQLENQQEWVISVYCDRDGLLKSVRASDKRVDRSIEALLASTTGFFSLQEWADVVAEITQLAIESVANNIVENCVNNTHLSLAGLAQDSIRHHFGAASGLVISGAYAVPRSSERVFRATLKALSTIYHGLGFSLHTIGPRVPTIFARWAF